MTRQVRVGMVGAGWMGATLLKRLSEHPAVVVRALCEVNADRGKAVLEDLGLTTARLVGDFDNLVDDPDVDAVWIASPNAHHGPQSIAALEAGKHVFSEKPAATGYLEHLRQLELCQANPHLKTFVDYILYFDTFEQRLREMVAGGGFGKVTQIQVNYRHPINIAGDKNWKLQRSSMGDAIGMGINHAISVILFALSSQARPVCVYATNMPAQVRGFECAPIWNILITFDNGACGLVFGNIDISNGYDAYHHVSGTRGALIFDSLLDRSCKVRLWQEGVAGGRWVYPLDPHRCQQDHMEPWPIDTTTPDSGDVVEHQTSACVAHFVNCILNGGQSPLSFVNSAMVSEIGWASQVSARLGQPVQLPVERRLALECLC